MIKFRIPVYLWRAVTFVYMAALFYVSQIPKVIPGPSTSLKETVHNSLHIPAYAALTFLIWKSFEQLPLRTIAGLSFVYGLINEVIQMFVPERTGSLTDVLLNAVGIVLTVWIIALLEKKAAKTGGKA